MKLLSLLLTAILCATASAQTIKTLGYNSTNGVVVASTGTNVLTFIDSVKFDGGITITDVFASGFETLPNTEIQISDDGIDFNTTNAATTTRGNLGFSTNLNTLWTATNSSNARTAIGLGNTNSPSFASVTANFYGYLYGMADQAERLIENRDEDAALFQDKDDSLLMSTEGWYVANTTGFRSAIGLPLAALTNTSNVTAMRALSGSTNTNHPYSGSISVTGTNNTNTLVFSNGILQSVQ